MIPAGRTAVDLDGLAEVYGRSVHQLKRQQPWEEPGHPPTLTTGTPSKGHPRLWDRDQVRAYVAGEPVPALPSEEDPADLLDARESAELLGITRVTWNTYAKKDREADSGKPTRLLPAADAVVCGTEHWKRSTIQAHRQLRQERASAPRGGRPRGSADAVPQREAAEVVAGLLAEAEANGEELSYAEIGRRTGLAYSTVLKHAARYREQQPPE
ncbi:hypothetical protein JOF53_007988 [Crossiella equi]|uniref:Uncharacterized protein n=1 Tax=Crossiella equi TaxID=130796 RepID=A0ABS5ARD5_9PSEU|nr:hypothetical protein [Crossiella equi]MBP2479116.1 hypothetical protein [Crossiella equi]